MSKKYTFEQRADFHKKRINNTNVSETKQCYSRNWLDGYTDTYAEYNYKAVCAEIEQKKGYVPKSSLVGLHGYRNGLRARLDKKAAAERGRK